MKQSDALIEEIGILLPEGWRVQKVGRKTRSFHVLDSYTAILLSSGAALLEFPENPVKIEFLPDGIEEKLDASMPQKPFEPSCLPAGKLRNAVIKMSDPWLLRLRARGTENVEQYRLENEDGKSVAHVFRRTFQCAKGDPVTALKIQSYRGYEDEVSIFGKRIKAINSLTAVPPVIHRSLPESVRIFSEPIPGVQPDESARKAVAGLGRHILDRVKHYEPGVLENNDPEITHQYRVSLRRMRSLVALLKTAFLEEETEILTTHLKLAMQNTNRLRDLDVQIKEVAGMRPALPDIFQPGLDRLIARLQEERKQEFESVHKALTDAKFDTRFAPVTAELDSPDKPDSGTISSLLAKAIVRRHRGIIRKISELETDVLSEKLHSLRVSCKKLRYLLEFFPQILDRDLVRPLVKDLKKLQNLLGRYNDLAVLEAFLLDQAKRQPKTGSILLVIGAIVMKLHEERIQLSQSCIQAAHTFSITVPRKSVRSVVRGVED